MVAGNHYHERAEIARQIKLANVGRNKLRIAEESWRAMLARHGAGMKDGKPSLTKMDQTQLAALIRELVAKGFVITRPGGDPQWPQWMLPRIQKLNAMWFALADAGVVRERKEAAMVKWLSRFTGGKHPRWATDAQLDAGIEAMKKWANREGVKLKH